MSDFIADALRTKDPEADIFKSLRVFYATNPRFYTPQSYEITRRKNPNLVDAATIITYFGSWLDAWEAYSPERIKIWKKSGQYRNIEQMALKFAADGHVNPGEPEVQQQIQQTQQSSSRGRGANLRQTLNDEYGPFTLRMWPYPLN